MSADRVHVTIPRATGGAAGYELARSAAIPVLVRDDLDPYSPPLQYADGRVEWSGHPTREARDAARAGAETSFRSRRASVARHLVATRELASLRLDMAHIREARLCGTLSAERAGRIRGAIEAKMARAYAMGGKLTREYLYEAGVCWYPHAREVTCAGCDDDARLAQS